MCSNVLLWSLPLPGGASVSERGRGLRNGDRLSMSSAENHSNRPTKTTEGPELHLQHHQVQEIKAQLPRVPSCATNTFTHYNRCFRLELTPFWYHHLSLAWTWPETPGILILLPYFSLPVFRPRLVVDEEAVG